MAKTRNIIFQFRLHDDPEKNKGLFDKFLKELQRDWKKNEEVESELASIKSSGGAYDIEFLPYVPKLSDDVRGIEIIGQGDDEYDQMFELAILILESKLQKRDLPYIMRASKERFTAGFEDLHMKLDELDEVLKEKSLTEDERKSIIGELSDIVAKLDFLAMNIRLIEDRIVEMMNRYELEIPKTPASLTGAPKQPAMKPAPIEEVNKPRDDFVRHFSAGSGYFDLGLYREAAEEFRRAAAIDKKDFGTQVNLAWSFLLDNRIDDAIKKFEQITKAKPDYVHAYNGLGYALLRAERYIEARTALLRVLANPVSDKATRYFAHINLGLIAEREHDMDRAIREFEKAAALIPNNADAHFNIGNVYYNMGLYDEAERKYLKALEVKPGSKTIQHYLLASQAQVAAQSKDFGRARELLESVLKDDPEEPIFYNNYGSLLEKLGDFAGALKSYKEATRLDPNYAVSYFNLGYISDRMMNAKNAIRYYKKFLELVPDDKVALNNLGWDYFVLGEYEKAVFYYKKAAGIDENFTYPLNNLGWLYIKTEKFEEATQCYSQVLMKDPKNALAHNDLGYLYFLKKMYDRAIVELKKAVRFARPEDVAYIYAHYHLGVVYQEVGKTEKALEMFNKALMRDEKYVAAHEKVGQLLETIGKTDQAKAHYQKCLDLMDPQSPVREKILKKLKNLEGAGAGGADAV